MPNAPGPSIPTPPSGFWVAIGGLFTTLLTVLGVVKVIAELRAKMRDAEAKRVLAVVGPVIDTVRAEVREGFDRQSAEFQAAHAENSTRLTKLEALPAEIDRLREWRHEMGGEKQTQALMAGALERTVDALIRIESKVDGAVEERQKRRRP